MLQDMWWSKDQHGQDTLVFGRYLVIVAPYGNHYLCTVRHNNDLVGEAQANSIDRAKDMAAVSIRYHSKRIIGDIASSGACA
jgi:hypothetical protein